MANVSANNIVNSKICRKIICYYFLFSAAFTPLNYRGEPSPGMKREWPPYTGFGSEEDSLCSCMGLLPKPPRRDFIKFMEKDRHGLDSNVLRFVCRLDTTKPIDIDRRFIMSYFLSDDTISVFEPPVRNSGKFTKLFGDVICVC